MKKIFIITIVLILVILICKSNSDDEIRFRVIAHSNNAIDIIMKEKVVNELSDILFINDNKNNIKKNILNNLSTIENKINILFKNNNYNKSYNVIYGLNKFPRKEYNGKVYSEGLYESLVIEIGEAKGDNYWCFLYPSLCLSDFNNENNNKFNFRIIELFKEIF